MISTVKLFSSVVCEFQLSMLCIACHLHFGHSGGCVVELCCIKLDFDSIACVLIPNDSHFNDYSTLAIWKALCWIYKNEHNLVSALKEWQVDSPVEEKDPEITQF